MAAKEQLSSVIEREYEQYVSGNSSSINSLYMNLQTYLTKVVTPIFMLDSHIDNEGIEDVVQDTLVYIFEEGINKFDKGEALFATYCSRIAKNKAIDIRRRTLKRHFESINDEENNLINELKGNDNIEDMIIDAENKLTLCNNTQKCIITMMDIKAKPYSVVSSLFTLILFHRYNPDSKELSSPKWAYEELIDYMVSQGADRFICDMTEWMPGVNLRWNDDFTDRLDGKYDGKYISDIIFGEYFKVKDFENWSRRIREKVKSKLIDDIDDGLEL